MTLETIARLEKALDIDLLRSTLKYVHGYDHTELSQPRYLSDSAGENTQMDLNTGGLVDGYKRERK